MEAFLFSLLIQGIVFSPPSAATFIAFAVVALLLMMSAFASGSEIAFFSLTPDEREQLDDEKGSTDSKIKLLWDDAERTLATILVTNNLVNVTIIMVCNYAISTVIKFTSPVVEFICITVILTFLLLLFGEIMPKVYGSQNHLRFCRMAAPGVMLLRKIFHPVASLLMGSGVLVEKMSKNNGHQLTADDLEQALELTDKDDLKDEQNMLEGIIRFSDETAKEIMTPRQDVVGLDYDSTFEEVLKCIVDNNYSRMPIYQDNLDNIRGILYVKDLLPFIQKPTENVEWQKMIRTPYVIPETKKIDDLMREFQENKMHIALVVDEYGGTSGIVTMEDILEEIVGEISDEYDEEEYNYVKINRNTFIFEGKTLLSDVYKILDIDDETFDDIVGDADTLAGLMLEIKGDFPQLHEKLEYQNFLFEIMALEEKRISRVKIIIRDQPPKPVEEKEKK